MNLSRRLNSTFLLSIINLFLFSLLPQVSLPFSYDLGKPANVVGLTASGLGTDYTTSPKMKFDEAGGSLLLSFSTTPGTLTYTVRWNQGTSAPRFPDEFELLESDNGVLYTLVQSYNATNGSALSNGVVVNETVSNLRLSTRYLKWRLVTKTNGVIGLGAISLGQGINIPVANNASSVTGSSFVANWTNVNGANSYLLDVYTKTNTVVNTTNDLIISEYVEGSGNNKYIEIYNGTGKVVDLSDYKLQCFLNGATTPNFSNQLTGMLNSGDVTVFKNSSATVYTESATSASSCLFTGNDAVLLYKISTNSNVDIVGRIGEDPGSAWTSGSLSMTDKTLRRKPTVMSGISTNPVSGFPTLASEWTVYNIDDVSGLGSHSVSGTRNVLVNTPIQNSPFSVTNGATVSFNINGVGEGVYYYTVKSGNEVGYTISSNEIMVTTSPILSVLDQKKLEISILSSRGILIVKGDADFQIYDSLGKLIMTVKNQNEIQTIPLASGIYFVKTNFGAKKVMIQ